MSTTSSNPTRRMLTFGGVAAAAVVAGVASRRTWSSTQRDVVVIGGGMAGLSAALMLQREGVDVQIIEADKRMGGRCFTLRTGDGAFDCGATTIGPAYGVVRSFANEANVPLITPGARDSFSYHVRGEFVSPSEWATSSANMLADDEKFMLPEQLEFPIVMKHNKIESLRDWKSEDLLEYDVPLDAYLKANGVSDEALRLIDLTSNTMGLSQTSALFQMREFARLGMLIPEDEDAVREVYADADSNGEFQYVEGGMSTLIDGVASLLKTEPMLGDPVVAIDVEPDGASVTLASGKSIRAKSVICTAPYSALRSIAITPAPNPEKRAAIEQSLYTLTTHVFFRVTKPYWENDGCPAGLISDDVVERVMANYDDSGQITWLDAWMNGDAATKVDAMSEEDMMAFVKDRLETLRPSMKGAIEPVGAYSWGRNPYVKGNKYVARPGDVRNMYPWLAAPHMERLRFAGEHTRDYDAGLEAAAGTGIREAIAYLERVA